MTEDPVDYGPLEALFGTWYGDAGLDVAPEPDGSEESPYYETIRFDPAGDVDNAETQMLAIVRYHQIVSRKSSDVVFHDQVGFWTWDADTGVVCQSLVIPRGVAVLAGGRATGTPDAGQVVFEVGAAAGDPDWGIVEAPFLRDHARTLRFAHRLEVSGDELRYEETTSLEIYGRSFAHKDANRLTLQRRA